eukprot:TRINITY_DN7343_c1_g3_i1.p2 TRINITY_DN7343_c1_g3~~TRINITY_DN7343_c1_g3_i1.p2  ORF type:complete len:108 (+),score=25.68 TRINITY_DN7343_c1_g3_i1:438-761(+)
MYGIISSIAAAPFRAASAPHLTAAPPVCPLVRHTAVHRTSERTASGMQRVNRAAVLHNAQPLPAPHTAAPTSTAALRHSPRQRMALLTTVGVPRNGGSSSSAHCSGA